MKLFEALTYLGAAIAAFFVFMALTASNGAPQEAAGAALAVAIVAIPYAIHGAICRSRLVAIAERDAE